MKILLSGATGFFGKIILEKLLIDFEIKTIGKNVTDYYLDFSKNDEVNFPEAFDIIIHCAGKAHSLPITEKDSLEFFQINTRGTKVFLASLENSPKLPKAIIFISTVAVYGLTSGKYIDENSPLNAQDPYGKSKILAEKEVEEWCLKKNVIFTILRLPLIIGKNPKGNLASMIKGIKKGYYFNIGGGGAKKSIVLAEDVANFIPRIASIGGIYNLTDTYHPTFFELGNKIAQNLNKPEPKNISLPIALVLAKIGDFMGGKFPINTIKLKKITSELTFDDIKAQKTGLWKPSNVLETFKI